MLLLFFLAALTSGASFRARLEVWARGRGELGMWTQVGETVNGNIMSGKGAIYVDERVGPRNQNQRFP